jgi:hypothetical protein
VCLEALAEKGCSGQWMTWTVAVDMANKNKSLASESDGDVFVVGTIPSLGHSWGERGKFIGSKTKLFERVFHKSSGI